MSTELPEKESLEDNALENQKKEAWNEWIQKVGESLITSVSISSVDIPMILCTIVTVVIE